MWACAHEVAGPSALPPRDFPGSAICPPKADGAASSAQQTARARKRLIPRFVSSRCAYGFRVLVVDAEIRPEPTAEERDVILRALEEQVARDPRPPAYRSAWRDQGIRENADDADPEDPF
jgi:hypothetical protein